MAGKFKFVALGVIVIGLFMGVAFGLGVKYGKGKEPEAAQGVTLAQIQQMIGGAGGSTAGAGGGAGAGGAAGGGTGTGGGAAGGNTASAASARSTSGKITAVQGQTVTIELRPGVTQKLNLGTSTTVNKFSAGAGADLKEGSSVVVSGTRKDDGSFDVATINLVPPELVTVLSTGAPATTGTTPAAPAAGTPAPPAAPAPTATR